MKARLLLRGAGKAQAIARYNVKKRMKNALSGKNFVTTP